MKISSPAITFSAFPSCGTRGFSLVEVVIALAVFSFAFLAIISALPVGLSAAREANGGTFQTQIIRQVVGSLQETPYPSLANFTTNFTRDGYPAPPHSSGQAYYSVTATMVPSRNAAAQLPAGVSSANLTLVQLVLTTADHTTNYFSTAIPNLGSQ